MKNQRSDENLAIVNSTEKIVADLKSRNQPNFICIRDFFVTSCDYIIQKFPIDDEIFVTAQVANIITVDKESFFKLKFFIQKYNVWTKVIEVLNEDKT